MPLFLSDEEYERCSHDASLLTKKADDFIRQLINQLESVKAEADAASMTAEQTCSPLEQRHFTLASEHSDLQFRVAQLNASVDQHDSELAQLQALKQQIYIQSIEKDGEIQLLCTEASELHKSKRQLMELLEQKDLEITEKNLTIKSYLDKIVNLTENAASKEAKICDLECVVSRLEASQACISQEKDIVERHNSWLNDELKVKVDSLLELRKLRTELEVEMSAKLADSEKRCNESYSSLALKEDRVRELESKLSSLEQELLSSKDVAVDAEKQFCAEISTLTKLVELYKESSEERSKKAGELEGVIKALETRLYQVENDSKERLEKEVSTRKEVEKEAQLLKEKFDNCPNICEEDGQRLVPLSSFTTDQLVEPVEVSDTSEDHLMLTPCIPAGVSGTALAYSLLRDGWSLAKMYSKYQEAVDALRHERVGRKQSQSILERVLYEIEEKAVVIMEERAEHERTVEAYYSLSEKLEHALTEQTTLLRQIQEQKVDIRKHERDDTLAEKEIVDLQKQVAVLLKECRDLQLRAGFVSPDTGDAPIAGCPVLLDAALDCQQAVPEKLPPFKDITGLVEQNVQLRCLVRNLSEEAKNLETELKEKYEKELQKHNEDVASKVDRISAWAEEQKHMIEQLHTSVTMYKKLYEEEQKSRLFSKPRQVATEERRNDNIDLQECSQGHSRKAQEKALERLKVVEEELGNTRNELITTRSERDKLAIEVQLAREKLDRSLNDFEHQRDEYNIVRARNVEFSQLIIDYQRKLRESSEELNSAKEVSRNLNIEISLLKQEKEILLSSEKRFSDEIRNLTERNHRVQASLDTLQSTLEVREEARCAERKKQEEYMKQIEIEWASAKKELHEERENARNLTLERGSGMANALKQVEELQKELSDALHAVAAAEARASVAEVRCSELVKMKTSNIGTNSDLHAANEELDKLREEAQVNKEHMLQYKSIAQANDAALKQLEVAHENLKAEAENVVKLLEAELLSLGAQFHELEAKCTLKAEEIASAVANKEEALATLSLKFANMREECSAKTSQFAVMETQLTAIKDDLENERQKSHVTQANYERQVIMQSETIQELRRTSQTLSTLREEASQLRKLLDSLKIENNELKSRLETEKSVLRVVINDADKKYNEENEQNKTLHSQLEALHIKLAEMDRHSTGVSGSTSLVLSDDADGLQDVLKYLRRSKEIAETELSLVKQEKLRLQSQLETALKSVEAAQASLNAEQANYKAFLFSAEEFNSLQLQVREISLLRESNLQLREENKHNFQECQKLRESLNMARVELQNLHRSLEERQNDVEACKKEIDKERKEKEDLEKRVDELERCRSSDLEDFSRVRATLEQMKVNFREKEAQLEEINILCTEKQDVILHLEQDIFRSRMELSDRESRLNQNLQLEVSLKSDIERQKRITAQSKKRLENLSKEKEDLIKENHVLSKHLEDARQGKKIGGDAAGEQAMKEKEKEKDSRIQTLEKVVERLKEELKKEKEEHKSEKEKRLKTKKTISDSYENVAQERHKLLEELDKHKHGLKMLKDEFEKQNPGKESHSEVTTQSHFLSGAVLEDVASVYSQAVDNFELVAQPVAAQPGSSMAESSSAPMDISSTGHGTSAVALLSTLSPAPVSANVNPGTVEEKEKKFDMPRPTLEARRAGRKLVRPRISNPEDSQGDMDFSEQEGPESSAKPSSLNDADTQGNLTSSSEPSVRKRPSISSESEAQDLHVSGEHSADTAGPMLKKYKHMETPADVEEGQISEIDHEQSAVNLEDTEILPLSEEQIEDVTNTASGSKKTCGDSGNDVTETAGKQEELTIEPSRKEEILDDKSHVSDETFSKLNDMITSSDTPMVQAEHDFQQTVTETGAEPEEGEIPDILQVEDGGSVSFNFVESPKTGDMQSTEHATGTESLTGVDEVPLSTEEMELGEIVFFQPLEDVVNNAKDILTDEIGESSVGLRDNFEQPAVDQTQVKTDDNIKEETPEEPIIHLDKSSTTGKSAISKQGESSSNVGTEEGKTDDNMKVETPEEPIVHLDKSSTTSESAISKQGESSSIVGGTEEGKQTLSPRNQSSRTINLLQRARERASLRQAGMSSSLTTSRGRGRSPRGRGTRGRGRGQQEPGGKQG